MDGAIVPGPSGYREPGTESVDRPSPVTVQCMPVHTVHFNIAVKVTACQLNDRNTQRGALLTQDLQA